MLWPNRANRRSSSGRSTVVSASQKRGGLRECRFAQALLATGQLDRPNIDRRGEAGGPLPIDGRTAPGERKAEQAVPRHGDCRAETGPICWRSRPSRDVRERAAKLLGHAREHAAPIAGLGLAEAADAREPGCPIAAQSPTIIRDERQSDPDPRPERAGEVGHRSVDRDHKVEAHTIAAAVSAKSRNSFAEVDIPHAARWRLRLGRRGRQPAG